MSERKASGRLRDRLQDAEDIGADRSLPGETADGRCGWGMVFRVQANVARSYHLLFTIHRLAVSTANGKSEHAVPRIISQAYTGLPLRKRPAMTARLVGRDVSRALPPPVP